MRQQKPIQDRQGLQLNEQNLQILVETIPTPMWRAKPDGHIDYVNKRLLEYFGSPIEEIIGWGWMEKVHPDDVAFKVQSWLSNLEAMTSHDANCRFQGADGAYRWFNVRGEPLRDSDGSVQNWYGVLLDIDNQKKAEEKTRESELKLRQITETVPGLVWSNGPDGEPTHINQRMLDYSGLPFEEFMHRGWEAFVHPADFPETAEAFYHAIQTGTSYQGVMRLRRADGEFRWHHARCEPLCDRQGRVIQWYGLSVDIDERKKAEDLLRRSEAHLAEAQRLTHIGVAAYNETAILYGSEETFRIWGFDPAQGVPSREAMFQRIHPDDLDRMQAEVQRALGEKRRYSIEYRLVLPDGTVKHLESIGEPEFSASGELVEIVATQIDVTERRHAEDALREREAQLFEARRELRQMIDTIPIPLASYSADYRRDFVNVAWKQYTGLSDEAALGTEWSAVAHPDHISTGEKMWRDALATGEPWHAEERVRRADGQYLWFAIDRVAARDENGKIIKWYGTAYEIDGRKRAEDALRESEAKFRDYAETASDWFWEIGPDYKFTLLTENAFGSRSADRIGTKCWDHALDLEIEPEKWRLVWATLDAHESFRDFVYCTVDGSGAPMYVRVSGKPVFDSSGKFLGYRGTGTDVTAIVRGQRAEASLQTVQAELAHVSRVMTLGQLTASIAHEVNQPIGSARNNARAALNFLDRSPPDLGEVREALGCIVADADRAGGIIDRIRDQIKKVPPRSDPFDLNRALEEVIGLAQSMITENGVSVQSRLASGMAPVHGDRVQLQQVVLNLILNAVEAMRSVEANERQLLISTDQSEANGTLVAVRDSGPGIDPKHLELVFEAFYSTKSGMGMGLSICRSIIAAHGGRLWAAATEPRGALFQFTLPSAKSSIARPFAMRESSKKTSL
jgi:PAS domain S-box-containing protein